MADFDVSGSFAADVSKFNAGMASAGGAAQAMANQAKAAADKIVGSFAQIKLDQFKPWDSMVAGMSQANSAATELSSTLAATGTAAHGHATGIGFYAREVHALADEMLSGRFTQAHGTFANLAATFFQSHTALIPFAGALAAVGGVMAYLVIRSIEAKAALDQVRIALALGGVADPGSTAINHLVESLERLSGESYDSAAKTIAQFANMKNASLPLVEALSNGVVEFAHATGMEMPEAAGTLRRAFEDPVAGVRQLQTLIGGITGEQIAYVEQTARAGSASATQAALLRVFGEAMAGASASLRDQKVALQQTLEESARFAAVQGESAGMTDLFNARVQEQIRQIDARTEALRRGAEAVRGMPSATLDIRAGTDVTRQINPLETQLETAQGRVRTLESSIRALQDEWAKGPSGEVLTRTYNQLGEQSAALRTAQEEVRRLNAQIGNTTSYDQRVAKSNAMAAAEARDRIATTQELIAADQTELNVGTRNVEERRRVENALYQHQAELRRAQSDLEAALGSVDVANAQKGSEAMLAAQLRGINARRAAAGQDRAELARLDAEELNARATLEEANSAITRQAAQERMNTLTNEIRVREQVVREQANQGQTTHAAELASLVEFSRQREAIEREYLEKILPTYDDDRVAYDRYQRELTTLATRYAAERAQTERRVGQEIYQSWNQSFQQVGSSVSSQVMGIIRHTTTLRQAFGNVALDIAGQFVSSVAKMVAGWAAGQAAMLTMAVTGATARTTAATAGEAGSIAATIAAAIARINAGVAATIAGVSANQAPFLGPAAVAEGAAAGATVEAMSLAALALDKGTWNVPGDMLASIHAGEMVVPAFDAEAFRQTAGTSGGANNTHNWYIQALDARSFTAMLQDHASPLARIVAKAMNTNPSLRPAF